MARMKQCCKNNKKKSITIKKKLINKIQFTGVGWNPQFSN